MSENNYKKLVYNTAIFAVGNFGSKILTFLIVPLYTYVLTTAEYGTIDLFITSLGMVIPFSTMMVNEALIRFVLGKDLTPKEAASNCFAVFLFGAAISIAFTPVYKMIFKFDEYIWIFVALLVVRTFNQIYSEYFRAINQNVKFTIFGLITTATTLGFNVLFLLVFKWGMAGYLYATLLAAVIGTIYILVFSDFFKVVSFKCIDKKILKMILKYSIPLVPNSLMWWIMAAGDKYIINYFLGDSANGIYSLALKIPQIINMVYSLFIQAWQMSAIEVESSEDKKGFYQNVFNVTSFGMVFITIGIVMLIKPVYVGVMSKEFAIAWEYVPLLSVSTIISCYASFFSVVYTVGAKTNKVFITTALGAATNLLFNFILVRPLGMQGIAIGTCLGYFAVLLIRARDMKIEMNIGISFKRNIFSFVLLIIHSLILISFGEIQAFLFVMFVLCQFVYNQVSRLYEVFVFNEGKSEFPARRIMGINVLIMIVFGLLLVFGMLIFYHGRYGNIFSMIGMALLAIIKWILKLLLMLRGDDDTVMDDYIEETTTSPEPVEDEMDVMVNNAAGNALMEVVAIFLIIGVIILIIVTIVRYASRFRKSLDNDKDEVEYINNDEEKEYKVKKSVKVKDTKDKANIRYRKLYKKYAKSKKVVTKSKLAGAKVDSHMMPEEITSKLITDDEAKARRITDDYEKARYSNGEVSEEDISFLKNFK